jgi:hypothetical protein
MKALCVLILVSTLSFAQDFVPPFPTESSEVVPVLEKPETSVQEKVIEKAKPTVEVKTAEPLRTKTSDFRSDSTGTFLVGYQLFTTWVPSKMTLSYTHIFNEKWSLEGEYAWSSIDSSIYGIDLGEIREKRYTLQARRYVGNSFNWTFGFIYSDFNARLGSDILDGLGNEINSSFTVQNLGITGGFGNRWQWQNGFTLGVDWFRLNVPVVETAVKDNVLDDVPNAGDQDDVKKVIRTFNRVPTFVLLGLNFGYTF